MKNRLRLRLSDTLVVQLAIHRFMQELNQKMDGIEKQNTKEYQTVFDLWQTSNYIMSRLNELHDEQVKQENKMEYNAFVGNLKKIYKEVLK
jgi:hypothetical protein